MSATLDLIAWRESRSRAEGEAAALPGSPAGRTAELRQEQLDEFETLVAPASGHGHGHGHGHGRADQSADADATGEVASFTRLRYEGAKLHHCWQSTVT
jgi:mersacidin/lichenicidin family type 2 lantibiotic